MVRPMAALAFSFPVSWVSVPMAPSAFPVPMAPSFPVSCPFQILAVYTLYSAPCDRNSASLDVVNYIFTETTYQAGQAPGWSSTLGKYSQLNQPGA